MSQFFELFSTFSNIYLNLELIDMKLNNEFLSQIFFSAFLHFFFLNFVFFLNCITNALNNISDIKKSRFRPNLAQVPG